jgi:hypothetical protein
MLWADPLCRWTAVALTKNFQGSPHTDSCDISYQHAISLGGFSGGELCVESEDHRCVVVVDTHNKLARIDGRYVHWVRRFRGGDRYSLVFFTTATADASATSGTARKRAVHVDFLPCG